MTGTFGQGLEVAPQNLPELVPEYSPSGDALRGRQGSCDLHPYRPSTQNGDLAGQQRGGSSYGVPVDSSFSNRGLTYPSPYSLYAPTYSDDKSRKTARMAGGCSFVVLVLSGIIAFLSVAVVGLAAGLGAEVTKANDANNRLAGVTSTSFNTLDNGCSDTPKDVNGTTYKAFSFLGGRNFTMYCNLDTPGAPLLSLFAADWNMCMDACSAYTRYEPAKFGNNTNTTCAGVSFVPQWTSKTNATAGKAPGNCYLKPGPQNVSALYKHSIGTEVHAAILQIG